MSFTSLCFAAEASVVKPTFHASLKAATEAAAADQSLVLLVFSATWCAPCKLLKRTTLDAPEFLERGGPLHVAEVDIDADEKTANRFAVAGVPTLVLLTTDEKIVARRVGYLEVAELLTWIEEGRRRARAGQWEGTVPGAKLDALVAKASSAEFDTNDLQRLVAMLGEPDPGERAGAGKLLLAQREQAVPWLIEAVADPYLGVRIGASDALQHLAPTVASLDPWQSPSDLSNAVVTLRKWWSDSGTLPPVSAPRPADPTLEGSIKAALDDLRSDDPVRRTEAMSTLVSLGAVTLPAVREAIKRHERTHPRLVPLLEDVRWAILIPDSLDRRADGVRQPLARGASPERQAAAARLGRGGREAIDALAELANDADPLVVESAVRALSAIGGQDVIPAMAALLNAADSNLRMTAAQALGRTKSPSATQHLLAAANDPNEVVACAALAALEEVNAKDSPFNPAPGPKDVLDAKTIATLRTALSDSRWRVRATAAEVIGKLKVTDLVPDLKKLVDDPDGFVVKNALVALNGLSAAPETGRLLTVARRIPALQGDAVAMMARSASDEAVQAVTDLYDRSGTESRLVVLNALGQHGRLESRPVDDTWKPILTKAMSSPEARLRRAAADLLGLASPVLAAQMVGPFLTDEDAETRGLAAEVVLGVLAGRKAGALRGLSYGEFDFDLDEMVTPGSSRSKATKTNQPAATPERIATWHSNLLQHANASPGLTEVAAWYGTGDGTNDLSRLAAALTNADEKAVRRLAASAAISVILPKVPWPQGGVLLDALQGLPSLYVLAVTEHEKARPEIANHLLEPARFGAALDRLSGDDLAPALTRLLADQRSGNRRRWSLLAAESRTQQVVTNLLGSTNAAWRAAAVYVLGRQEAEKHVAVFAKAVRDPDPWVRAAGVQGMARGTAERSTLEARLGPRLADADTRVAEVAALALLEPELRSAAGLQHEFSRFRFGDTRAYASESFTTDENRPLTTLENKPAFLEHARRHLEKMNETAAFALLLAQYGEFDGLEKLMAELPGRDRQTERAAPDALLAGIALTRDAKYIPFLRRVMGQTQQEWELRKILRALKGMSGPEARQLRLEVNKRMRTTSTTGMSIIESRMIE